MSVIANLFSTLIEVWGEMFSGLMSVVPKVISFILWVLCAFIILPCVFVAGTLYPLWTEWGDSL